MKKTISIVLVLTFCMTVEVAKSDFIFGTPTNLGPLVNSPDSDLSACVSSDGLSLFFSSNRSPGGFRDFDLWVATRQAKNEDWGVPVHLGDTLNSRVMEWTPFISTDGLELYFAKGSWGYTDISVARRNSLNEPWGSAESLGPVVNRPGWNLSPSMTADGLELFFDSTRSGGYGGSDLYVTTRATTSDPWGTLVNLGPTINTGYGDSFFGDGGSSISSDGLVLFFHSAQPPGSASNLDIWMTRRATRQNEWEPPVRLDSPINGVWNDGAPRVSADGGMLYFVSSRLGGVGGDSDFWQASIIPICDLNGDRIVDSADVCIMVDHWGTDDPLCDIGPMPWGDGIVDTQDLVVLAKHLFEDLRLIAHWKLDETTGNIAHDSIDAHHGTCYGEPLWVSDSGRIGGGLQFDGIDDYVSTLFVFKPGEVSFSAIAWVKGGAPGQVIVSQANSTLGSNSTWLGTDPADGKLITGLRHSLFPSLESESIITDAQWHHVSLVYDHDGPYRHLYVDGVEVAKDTSPVPVRSSEGGLYFGASESLDATSFWSGLIDDVHVYDVALTAEEITALAQ